MEQETTRVPPPEAARLSLPLSYNQQGPWYLYRLLPENTVYNQCVALRIRGEVEAEVLRSALQTLVDRHESLRSRFIQAGGRAEQAVERHAALPFSVVSVAGASDEELHGKIVKEVHVPFDLSHSPLLRATLFARGSRDHVLLLVIHHIAADGWSIRTILLPELSSLYTALRRGDPVPSVSATTSYGDFIAWQEAMLSSAAGQAHWAYWKEQLSGPLPTLDLPADRPRPPLQRYQGEAHSFRLEEGFVRKLSALATSEGTTLPALLMAAFQTLLFRYTNQTDVIVGMLMAGRTEPRFDKVVGDFFNSVPIRCRPTGSLPFRQFLQEVYQRQLGALEHQDFPFPVMVERLNLPRDASRSPVFQVGFVYRRFPAPARQAPADLAFDALDIAEEQEGHFDINLIAQQFNHADQSLLVQLKFNTDLFDRSTIARMAGHLQALLEGVLADPGAPLGRLPILREAERRQIVAEWNDTKRAYPLDRCLHQLVAAQTARTPDAVALVFEGSTLTYRELDARANRLAHCLRESGVGPEVLVGVCMERSLEMVVALLAVLKAGGAYVPIDPEYPADRLSFMLEDSRVPLLLTQQRLAQNLPKHGARVLCVDTMERDLEARPADEPPAGARPQNAVYMIYTSGSTGRPKGAINHHRGVVNRLLWMQDAYRLTAEDRVAQKTPFSFDVAGWEFWWPLIVGARLIVAKPGGHKDTGYLAGLIAEHGITTIHFVPSMLRAFLQEPRLDLCKSLKRVVCSGEALTADVQDSFFSRFDAELHNLYGPTEAAIDVTFWRCVKGDGRQTSVPIGRPIANTQMYVLDGQLQPVPVGVPGELYIGGVNVGRGYLNRDELTRERFIADPFSGEPGARLYKTGDLARLRPDGVIEYLGRNDFQVKIRGFRIELGEIEAAITEQPQVRESLVVAMQEPGAGLSLLAYVVPKEGSRPAVDELRQALKRRLPEYMVPSRFVFLEKFPLSPNGKIDRHALPKPSAERPALSTEMALPTTEAQRKVADVWKGVLQIDRVGLDDNFFDLGGHSLLLAQAHALLQSAFGRQFGFIEMFRHPTVATLSAFLGGSTAAAAPASAPEEPGRNRRIVQRRRA